MVSPPPGARRPTVAKKPDEIVHWSFAWGSSRPFSPVFKEIRSTRADSLRRRDELIAVGYLTGPIARHVTRAPWMKPKKKEKK